MWSEKKRSFWIEGPIKIARGILTFQVSMPYLKEYVCIVWYTASLHLWLGCIFKIAQTISPFGIFGRSIGLKPKIDHRVLLLPWRTAWVCITYPRDRTGHRIRSGCKLFVRLNIVVYGLRKSICLLDNFIKATENNGVDIVCTAQSLCDWAVSLCFTKF
jgi:hypothetical protein